MLIGHRQRQREAWQRAAQLAAWLLAPYSKRRLTADKLIRFPPDPLDDDRAGSHG